MKYCNVFGLINDTPEIRAEYKRRHDEIWPEMLDMIQKSGLKNYSIWNTGKYLVEYYECEDLAAASAYIRSCEVKQRWDAYMSDILVYREDGSSLPLDLMFNVE